MKIIKYTAKAAICIIFMIVIIISAVFLYHESSKLYWDGKIIKLCKMHGGVKIFEYMQISREDAIREGLLKWGVLHIPGGTLETRSKYFRIEVMSKQLRSDPPYVYQTRTLLVRSEDSKILAEMILYSRRGGDMPTYAHASGKSCPNAKEMLEKFRSTIQIKG